jgi:hypothetical protein
VVWQSEVSSSAPARQKQNRRAVSPGVFIWN